MGSINNNGTYDFDGYIVILSKLARFYSDTREDVSRYCDNISIKRKDPDNESFGKFNSHLQSFLTFGDFDRISFNKVDRFSNYYDLDEKSKYWLGKNQYMFLYRIKGSKTERDLFPYTNYNEDTKKHDYGFCIKEEKGLSFYSALTGKMTGIMAGKECFFPFFLLTQVSFSNEVITRTTDYSAYLKTIKEELSKEINKVIHRSNYNVFFDIYGCMNSSEIAILWLCEQYSDVLNLINYLKDFKFTDGNKGNKGNNNLFVSFYSVIGRTLTNSSQENFGSETASSDIKARIIENCKGTARINITVGDKYNAGVLEEQLKEKFRDRENLEIQNTMCLGGEYDLRVIAPVKNIYFQFAEMLTTSDGNGIFKDKNIREMILGVKTDLMADIEDVSKTDEEKIINLDALIDKDAGERVKQFNGLFDELSPDNDIPEEDFYKYIEQMSAENRNYDDISLRNLYRMIRYRLKAMFDSHTGSIDTLDMLYRDYLSNIHETYNAVWRNDYHYQFKKSLIYILKLFDMPKKKMQEIFWQRFTETIDNLRQQTVHFSQSGKLMMQIPASHLRYTGNVDRLFHSYYGISKAVLEDSYQKQEETETYQSELLPIITTNSTPKITSRLYHAGMDCDDLRILQIDIPYSLLFDPITGFPHMVHELFHYIAPNNRKDRNEAILNIAINEALALAYCSMIEKGIRNLFYNAYLENPDYLDRLNFKRNGEYDSPNCKQLVEDFKSYMSVTDSGEGIKTRTLKTSISHSMFFDEAIKNVCESIRKEIINNKGIVPKKMTWNTTLISFKEVINSLSVDRRNVISERLAEMLHQSEKIFGGEITESEELALSNALVNNTLIRITNTPSELNRILYQNKYKLLNPYHFNLIEDNTVVMNNVEDVFIKGIREAVPDLAMIHYCKMSDIDYLVTYARFTKDNGYGIIAECDVVRLFFVLTWISKKEMVHKIDGCTIIETFEFADKGLEFVKKYVVEYMPHHLDKKCISSLLIDAMIWFGKFLEAAKKFNREYAIYYDQMQNIRDSYSQYFNGSYIKNVSNLVEVYLKRKKERFEKRTSMISDPQWGVVDHYLKKENIIWDKDTRKQFSCDLDSADFVEEYSYNTTSRKYEEYTFERILEFLHLTNSQKTFSMLGKMVIKHAADDKTEPITQNESATKEETSEDDLRQFIRNTIDANTSYHAWGMSGFSMRVTKSCRYLQMDNGNKNIWFKVIPSIEKILPTSLLKELSKCRSDTLYGMIRESLEEYLAENEGKIEKLKNYEAVARMTIDAPCKDSNLILWHGNLLAAMESYEKAIDLNSINDDADLLIFSPGRYLKARNTVLNIKRIAHTDIPYPKSNTTEIVFSGGDNLDVVDYYCMGNNTGKLLEKCKPDTQIHIAPERKILSDSLINPLYPVPFNFIDMAQSGRFLAYNLLMDCKYILDEKKKLELDELQRDFLYRMSKDKKILEDNLVPYIQTHTFLYRIRIGSEIFREFRMMTRGIV